MSDRETRHISFQLSMLAAILEGAARLIRDNLDRNNLPGAVIAATRDLKGVEQTAAELYDDYATAAMSETEKTARRKAHEFTKANMAPWDWPEEAEADPLSLGLPVADLISGMSDYFGEDAPADLIRALKAC